MIRLLAVCFLLLTVLAFRFFFFFKTQPSYKTGQEVALTTTLLSQPQITGKIQKFYVNDILIITSLYPEYQYGQTLTIAGTLESKVLNNKKPVLMVYLPKIQSQQARGGLALIEAIRQKITIVFKNSLPNNESSLILGIVFGFKANFSKELMDALRTSGTLHVVAASGMNVTMVGSFLSSLFGLFLRRQIAVILTIVGIFIYAVLSGLDPSIVRASIMGAIAYSALLLGRQNLAIISLMITGFLMLLISPRNLFNIGFQLSFLSTVGLIIIKPRLDRQDLFKNINKFQMGNDLTTTISAQLATLPILLLNFGNYSPLSVVANTFVLWTIAPVMILGGIASILSLFFESLAKLLLLLALPLLIFFEKVVGFFASLGGLRIENFPIAFTVGYYFLLISIILFLRSKNA